MLIFFIGYNFKPNFFPFISWSFEFYLRFFLVCYQIKLKEFDLKFCEFFSQNRLGSNTIKCKYHGQMHGNIWPKTIWCEYVHLSLCALHILFKNNFRSILKECHDLWTMVKVLLSILYELVWFWCAKWPRLAWFSTFVLFFPRLSVVLKICNASTHCTLCEHRFMQSN